MYTDIHICIFVHTYIYRYVYERESAVHVHAGFKLIWRTEYLQAPPSCVKIKRGLYQCALSFLCLLLLCCGSEWRKQWVGEEGRRVWIKVTAPLGVTAAASVQRSVRARRQSWWAADLKGEKTSSKISQWQKLLFAFALVVFSWNWHLVAVKFHWKTLTGSCVCFDMGLESLFDWWQNNKSALTGFSQFCVNTFLQESGLVLKQIFFSLSDTVRTRCAHSPGAELTRWRRGTWRQTRPTVPCWRAWGRTCRSGSGRRPTPGCAVLTTSWRTSWSHTAGLFIMDSNSTMTHLELRNPTHTWTCMTWTTLFYFMFYVNADYFF